MTLCQFKFLEDQQQSALINQQAIVVAKRTEGNIIYRLLCLHTFYIEEEWVTGFIERRSYTCFNTEEKLMPYTGEIDLWSLKLLSYNFVTRV